MLINITNNEITFSHLRTANYSEPTLEPTSEPNAYHEDHHIPLGILIGVLITSLAGLGGFVCCLSCLPPPSSDNYDYNIMTYPM